MPSAITRRQLLLSTSAMGLGLLAGCGRLPWQDQTASSTRRPRIGCLFGTNSPMFLSQRFEAFRQGLRERGYIEGYNIDIEYRSAEGDIERLPGLAAQLASSQVDILLTGGSNPTQAAKVATTTIPIVMVGIPDPVGDGFVASLARPGGNITGLSSLETGLSGKRLEFLKLASPTASRVAILWNAATPGMAERWRETQIAADGLGVQLVSVNAQGLVDVEDLFEAIARENANGLLVWSFALTNTHAARVADLATQSRLPTMYDQRDFVDASGLMSYAADSVQLYRRAAYYVDRILKGAKPADLPVEQPMVFDFVVNMKTAKELGITFPNEIMLQVTEVIE